MDVASKSDARIVESASKHCIMYRAVQYGTVREAKKWLGHL